MTEADIRLEYEDPMRSMTGGRDYDISFSCRNFTPKNSVRTMDMGDYSRCDSCTHLRGDLRCGLAQQTLS